MWTKYIPVVGFVITINALTKASDRLNKVSRRYTEAVMVCLANPRNCAAFETSEAIYRETEAADLAVRSAFNNFRTAMISTIIGVVVPTFVGLIFHLIFRG